MEQAKAALIDEYGELKRQIAAFAPVTARSKVIESEFEHWYADVAPDATITLEGNRYTLQVGARAIERSITDMKRLYKLIGVTKFLEWCTFRLSDIDRLLSDTSSILTESRTGRRSIKPVAKEQLAIAIAKPGLFGPYKPARKKAA